MSSLTAHCAGLDAPNQPIEVAPRAFTVRIPGGDNLDAIHVSSSIS
jgi:hypothetical protein